MTDVLLQTTAGGADEVGAETEMNLYRDKGQVISGICQVDLSAGDTVVIRGRASLTMAKKALATVTSTTEAPFLIAPLPRYIEAERTTDGLAGEARVEIDQLTAGLERPTPEYVGDA